MCAISGMIGLETDEAALEKMLETMHRRGPDAQGRYQEKQAVLLHSRLAIIDPDGGAQPMKLHWAGEEYVLVYNGELYNTEELRGELVAAGHHFQGHSDTEVILHAYAHFGAECVNRFNGIFAFAVWEKKAERLFMARDRIGVKPLFYSVLGKGMLFASEIKTLLAYPGLRTALDREGAAQLILLGPGRLPGSGVFRDVFEIEPGCCGWFSDGNLAIFRYWKLTDRENKEDFADTCDHVRYLVTDAVHRQMVSDVPIGTFLSGGLDSSIITAVCAGKLAERGESLQSFFVDYLQNDRYFRSGKFQPDPDSEYIDLMVQWLRTEHNCVMLSAQQLLDTLEAATIARDLPGMADVDASLLLFCNRIREKVKVTLSGECADEIFGGYPWYRDPEVRSREGFPWAQNLPQRASLLQQGILDAPEELVMDAYRDTCRETDLLPGQDPEEIRMKQMVNLNFRWFMQTLLDRKDRMSMYSGLEVRVPFCDYRIAEYLYGVPWKYKDYRGREKGLLRKAVDGLLPQRILERRKSPYPKTFDPSYEQAVCGRLKSLLTQDSSLWSVVNKQQVRKLLEEEPRWPWYGQLMRRPQTAAYLLQLEFWLRHYRVEILF